MQLQWLPLTEQYFDLLYKSEADAFPAPEDSVSEAPKSKKLETYSLWHSPDINLSQICIDQNGQVIGLISIVPVSLNGWSFIHDKNEPDLNEYNLREENLFTPGINKEIGFHIYMIQKYNESIKNFTELSYRAFFRNFHEKAATWNNPQVLGLSGYSVSYESIFIAFNKLSRNEVRSMTNHAFINPKGNLEVVPIESKEQFNELLNKGYVLRNRCRLTSVKFAEPSIIWQWFEEEKRTH